MSNDIKVLNPGKTLTLDSGVNIIVYPLGLRQLNKFSQAISGAINAIINTLPAAGSGVSDSKVGEKIMSQLAGLLLTDLIDLLKDCLVVDEGYDLDTLAHYEIPPILDMWIEESFGEEKKWKPWITMIEAQILKFTGTKVQILDTLSASFSLPDTPGKTSSKKGKKGSHTKGGQSRSSTSG